MTNLDRVFLKLTVTQTRRGIDVLSSESSKKNPPYHHKVLWWFFRPYPFILHSIVFAAAPTHPPAAELGRCRLSSTQHNVNSKSKAFVFRIWHYVKLMGGRRFYWLSSFFFCGCARAAPSGGSPPLLAPLPAFWPPLLAPALPAVARRGRRPCRPRLCVSLCAFPSLSAAWRCRCFGGPPLAARPPAPPLLPRAGKPARLMLYKP